MALLSIIQRYDPGVEPESHPGYLTGPIRNTNRDMAMQISEIKGLPDNFREVDEEEIVKQSMLRSYLPIFMDYRQVTLPDEKHMMEIRGYWFHDGSGVGMSFDYWAGKVRWFRFSLCEHENEVIGSSNCYREYRCKKCGYEHAVDSSG